MTLLAIDLGTTGCRCILTNEKLEIIGQAYSQYPTIKMPGGIVEQSADDWWEVTKKVVKDAIFKSGIMPESVKSIGISAQGISFVIADERLEPIRNSINWLDTRASDEKTAINVSICEKKMYVITGKKASESSLLAKLLWLKRNESENYKKTYKVLMAHDYILYKLCGEIITDHTMAAGTHLYDINQRKWSEEILGMFQIDKNILPEIKQSGHFSLCISKHAAQELGLAGDTMVAVGGQDQKCAILGAGINDNITTLSLGTSAAIIRLTKERILEDDIKIFCQPSCMAGYYVYEGVIGTACAAIDWYKKWYMKDCTHSDICEEVFAPEQNGEELFFYPHLSGAGTPYLNKKMKGFIYGFSLSSTAGEMLKSIYEGIAYQIYTNYNNMNKTNGISNEIRVMGGGSNNSCWCKIIADVTNSKVVRLYTAETAAIGAAILAGVSAGLFKDVFSAYKHIKVKDVFLPDKESHKRYMGNYGRYAEIEKKLNEILI